VRVPLEQGVPHRVNWKEWAEWGGRL
jgi:hypothetical protein